MKKRSLFNLTLHQLGEEEVRLLEDAGFTVEGGPRGVEAGPGQEGLEQAVLKLEAELIKAKTLGASVLIGDSLGVLAGALRRLQKRLWPEMVLFETVQLRDENGRLSIRPVGVLHIPGGNEESQ